ncbi:MAG: rhomboid family intramembrane serine protease [Flavobacteriaceae bacterium]|nr:rhomboid family intramembrane serine protease [Flavobacteriaceae bacterium]
MFQNIPPITKNLLILNALFFAAKYVAATSGINLDIFLGAFYPESVNFKSYQVITHMFMHGDMMHFFFNMFALWMFGGAVERTLGEKKFIILYFAAGLGAFVLFNLTNYFEINAAKEAVQNSRLIESVNEFARLDMQGGGTFEQIESNLKQWLAANDVSNNQARQDLFLDYSIPMVGASGAIFGVLAAFGMMFPNAVLMLIFPPIPLKAKYFIPIYIAIELYLAIQANPGDNVAHYAHIGGAIIGFLLIKMWRKSSFNRWDS